LLAIGRKPDVKNIGLEQVGIALSHSSGKIIVDSSEKTSIKNIFAIGDCAEGRPELTPSAILAGKLLANRLFGGASLDMDYVNVPTTVFTPLEYACVGLAEEDAVKKYGEKGIDVYHTQFKPLEWSLNYERESGACYTKLICEKETHKIVGIHFLGPHAGEVIQGYAVALKMGAKKEDFERTVGIHPTCAEVYFFHFFNLHTYNLNNLSFISINIIFLIRIEKSHPLIFFEC
jgi:thioredoxin reductase (NADPH)